MASIFLNPLFNQLKLGHNANSGTITNFALDSAYVAGVSGDALAYVFISWEASTLVSVYFYVTTVTGTPGNLVITVELTNDTAGIPGATIHATTTATINGSATWAKATFSSPYTLAIGTKYHVRITNTSIAPITDYITVSRIGARLTLEASNDMTCRTSTNGGTTYTGGTTSAFVGVLEFGNGVCFGQPYTTTNTAYANNTRERGILISSRADALKVWRFMPLSGSTTGINGSKLYKSTTAPSSSPGAGEYTGFWSSTLTLAYFDDSAIIAASAAMRLVWTFSGNSTNPGYFTINDYARYSAVQNARPWAGIIQATIDDGASGWTDDPASLPLSEIWVKMLTEPAAAGGGGGAMAHGPGRVN